MNTKKNKTISLRCEESTKLEIEECAKKQNLTVSEYLIRLHKDTSGYPNTNHQLSELAHKIHTLLNRLDAEQINKKTFIKNIRKELERCQY